MENFEKVVKKLQRKLAGEEIKYCNDLKGKNKNLLYMS